MRRFAILTCYVKYASQPRLRTPVLWTGVLTTWCCGGGHWVVGGDRVKVPAAAVTATSPNLSIQGHRKLWASLLQDAAAIGAADGFRGTGWSSQRWRGKTMVPLDGCIYVISAQRGSLRTAQGVIRLRSGTTGSVHRRRRYGTIGLWRRTGLGWTTRRLPWYARPFALVSRVLGRSPRRSFDGWSVG